MGSLEQEIRDLINKWQDVEIVGNQRARALAFTKLEEAEMWASKIER
jgi:recombinational DNA repair protein RecR